MGRCGLSSTFKRIFFVIFLSFFVVLIIQKKFLKEKFISNANIFGRDTPNVQSFSNQKDTLRLTTNIEKGEDESGKSQKETEIHYESEEEFMKRMTSRMKERRVRVRNFCRKLGLPKEPFREQALMEAKRYGFVFCRVPKAGSTNMDRVFGQLIKESDYPKIRSRTGERNHSPHRVEFVTERRFALDEIGNYLSVILVRDPFIRLLSSYLMKINNKGKNPDGKLNATWAGAHELPINVTFSDYVDHLLTHPGLFSTFEKHWARFVDLCQPCHVRYDVIAQLETIEEDTRYFLTLVGAPRNVTYNSGQGQDGKSKTKTDHLAKYYDTVKENKLRSLYQLYKADFELFGYSVPEKIHVS